MPSTFENLHVPRNSGEDFVVKMNNFDSIIIVLRIDQSSVSVYIERLLQAVNFHVVYGHLIVLKQHVGIIEYRVLRQLLKTRIK